MTKNLRQRRKNFVRDVHLDRLTVRVGNLDIAD